MATITSGYPISRRRAGETSPLRHLDLTLLVVPFLLSALGLLMIYSSTREKLEREGVSSTYFVERQAIAIGIGIVAMVVMIAIDYRRFRDLWALVYIAVLPLLVGVLVLGASVKGAQAWFDIGPLQFQPSEIAKIAVIIAVAGYCHQHRGDLDAWRLGVAVLIAGIPIALVL